ncbi:MAG: tyrosine-type recombinase/integrase [Candidatus Nanopelagicaceae bacterium]|nr:tyrosine-type recombinase/integrase [Candidatus Nanopelagicaceae bacterium]
MARRANGQGSVYQERKSGRWIAAFTLPPTSEGKKRVPKRVCKSKAEAHKALVEMQIQAKQRTLTLSSTVTIRKYAEYWFSNVLTLRGLKPSSLSNYQQMLHYYILPTLGSKRLDTLRSQDVLEMINQLKAKDLSTNTIRRARSILHNMMESATEQDLIAKNPVTRTSAVRRPETEKTMVQKSYSVGEVNQALSALRGSPYEGLFKCMVLLGMRIGEVIALRWEQVDLEESSLWVIQTEAHIPTLVGDGTWVTERVNGSTKSNRKRKLHLTEGLSAFFFLLRREQAKTRMPFGPRWNPENYVFVTNNGTPFAANNVRRGIDSVLSRQGIRHIRLHDLRHTAGFLSVEAGVGINDVQDMLGHASIQMTKDIYVGHVQAGSDRAVLGLESHIAAFSHIPNLGRSAKQKGK